MSRDWGRSLLSKEKLDAIDLKNAESNFTDALYDTSREQAELTLNQIGDWLVMHYTEDVKRHNSEGALCVFAMILNFEMLFKVTGLKEKCIEFINA